MYLKEKSLQAFLHAIREWLEGGIYIYVGIWLIGQIIFKHFESLYAQFMKTISVEKVCATYYNVSGWIGEPHSIVI